VQAWLLGTVRFWLARGVDGFRLDTVNYYVPDNLLRDDPADFRRKEKPEWNPYMMQYHILSKNQPENLSFLERLRSLLDEYDGRAMVGEMGESHHAIRMMGEYTTGKRLHKCYSFEMLGDHFNVRFFRSNIEEFFAGAPKGWPTWAFSNHDVIRHVSRWQRHGNSREALAKLCGALLMSLEGSICMYQGEELGQTETDLELFELTDPQGIRFWPENKGRDGCRTPMVWDNGNASSGFSTGRPWLPIKEAQAVHHAAGQIGRPDSVLELYRSMIRLRRDTEELRTGRTVFFDVSEPVLAFTRGGSVLCIFNLSPEQHRIRLAGAGAFAVAQGAEHHADGTMTLHPNGFGIMEVVGDLSVEDASPASAKPVSAVR
jgi:alpha-glucosidase